MWQIIRSPSTPLRPWYMGSSSPRCAAIKDVAEVWPRFMGARQPAERPRDLRGEFASPQALWEQAELMWRSLFRILHPVSAHFRDLWPSEGFLLSLTPANCFSRPRVISLPSHRRLPPHKVPEWHVSLCAWGRKRLLFLEDQLHVTIWTPISLIKPQFVHVFVLFNTSLTFALFTSPSQVPNTYQLS